MIVTGTAGGGEIRKLDASYAITNVSAEDIGRFSPKSTADLLKMVPGVWSESSGGVAGANVFVRGMPSTGDAPFYTLQLEGAPIYPAPTLSFLENSSMFRIDETIDRVEGLRGGPQSVQDNGQPGLTTNFLLRRGQDETEGVLKYTTSDYDLQRVDGRLSGSLGDGLYYMVGGYVRTSPGVRDTGYTSDEGSQFTVNITKELDAGEFNVYHRVTDDHGTWYLPSPLNVPGVDNDYVQNGTLNRNQQILTADGEVHNVDLADGRGWDGSVSGMTFNLDINDNWSLNDSLSYTKGDADTLGFVPEGGAVEVGTLFAGMGTTGAVTGRDIAADEFAQLWGVWDVRKDVQSFTNNLALTGSYENFELVLGYYTATTSVDEFWSLGNQQYFVVENGGEMITGAECLDSCAWNYDIDASGDATDNALYATLAYDVSDRLTLDLGLRRQSHEVDYSVDEGLTGSISKFVDYDEDASSYTLGANYDLNESSGVFGRISRGYRLPFFDDFRDNYDVYQAGDDMLMEVQSYELGYKAQFDYVSAYITLFMNEVEDSSVSRPGVPAVNNVQEAQGIEVDVRWVTDYGLSVLVNGTLLDTEITEGDANIGNEAQRQPGYQVRVSPSYEFEMGSMSASVYGAVTAVDSRYADAGNTVTLDSYTKLDLGMILYVGSNLDVQLALNNITDEDALTEGDPRNPSAPNGRYILPQNAEISLAYHF